MKIGGFRGIIIVYELYNNNIGYDVRVVKKIEMKMRFCVSFIEIGFLWILYIFKKWFVVIVMRINVELLLMEVDKNWEILYYIGKLKFRNWESNIIFVVSDVI